MSLFRNAALLMALSFCIISRAHACDLCAIHASWEAWKARAGTFDFSLAEQFTYYGNTQTSGHFVENEHQQHLASSVTQLGAGYALTDDLSLQVSLPYINRRFRRIEEGEPRRGSVAGIGDLTLFGRYTLLRYEQGNSSVTVQVLGGIELPTGDTDTLGEEALEHEEHSSRHDDHEESEIQSAIHGHDLALGSGSYDFPVGAKLFAARGRAFIYGEVQYVFRSEGDFDYRYADDLIWGVGPAYYFVLEHDDTVAVRANLSGEYKRKDEADGEQEDDTGISSLFLGPELIFTVAELSGTFGLDLPLEINNSGFQAVADYRIRAALSYRF